MAPGNSEQRPRIRSRIAVGVVLRLCAASRALSGTKIKPRLGALPPKLKPETAKVPSDFRNFLENLADLLADFLGVTRAKRRWEPARRDDEVALVFVGNEAFGNVLKYEPGQAETAEEENDRDPAKLQECVKRAAIAFVDACYHAVDAAKNQFFLP